MNVYITRFTTILLHRAHAGGILWHTYHLLCLQICKGIEKNLRYMVQVQGVYHLSKYTKFLPPRVCIACCAVLRFKSQPISLLPFHLSRPSVGKNSDNHHNVKASQGAKVLFYNLVILKPLVIFSMSSERKQASDHRRVPSPCIPIMINLHKMLFRKVS